VGVDRVELASAATCCPGRLFGLEHDQTGCCGGAGQTDAIAASALDRDRHARPGGMVEDPSQQLGIAGGVVTDRGGRDRAPGGQRDLDLVGVAMCVDADDGVDEICQHRHDLLSFRGAGQGRYRSG